MPTGEKCIRQKDKAAYVSRNTLYKNMYLDWLSGATIKELMEDYNVSEYRATKVSALAKKRGKKQSKGDTACALHAMDQVDYELASNPPSERRIPRCDRPLNSAPIDVSMIDLDGLSKDETDDLFTRLFERVEAFDSAGSTKKSTAKKTTAKTTAKKRGRKPKPKD